MIMHSAGDIETYPLLRYAPSISVHFCQVGAPMKPWALWRHKSKFSQLDMSLSSVRAAKVSETMTLAALACYREDGTLDEEAARAGLTIILGRARQSDAVVYFQYRSRSFPETLRQFIAGFAGVVVCYLSKVDNGAQQ